MSDQVCPDCESQSWVGKILKGVCGEVFNEEYGEKTIEAVGPDWVVVREEVGRYDWEWNPKTLQNTMRVWVLVREPFFASFSSHEKMHEEMEGFFKETEEWQGEER